LTCDERVFRALGVIIVPEASALVESEWQEAYAIIGSALSARPRSVVRQLSVFVRVINLLSLAKYRRGVLKTTESQRAELLRGLERSRVLLLRRGLWGLRTLVFMGYYGRPSVAREIGYRADARGWLRIAESPVEA
jgi:hypothetical protein